MKRAKSAICVIMMMFVISACAGRTSNDSAVSMREQEEIPGEAEETTLTASPENGSNGMPEQEESREKVIVMDELLFSVGDKNLSVEWEDNESVDALKDLAGSEMKINMAMYGGFEQVGSIGTSLPRNDSQMTTSPGDIVLYSGNQIVIFYGSNSWAYTRLGKITGLNEKELEDTFGNGDEVSEDKQIQKRCDLLISRTDQSCLTADMKCPSWDLELIRLIMTPV